jgi:hypothetical protein
MGLGNFGGTGGINYDEWRNCYNLWTWLGKATY